MLDQLNFNRFKIPVMRIKVISLFFFCLAALYVSAQPSDYTEKPRKIKMPKYYVTVFPKKTIPITGITMVQAVWDSSSLGYLQKGLMNIRAEAIPENELTKFLQKYFDLQYKDLYKKSGSHLVIMVKDMRVNETTYFSSEFAFGKLVADAWISEDQLHYKKIASVDTVLGFKGYSDVTSLHGENLARGFYYLVLTALENKAAGRFLAENSLTQSEILNQQLSRFNVPVITDNSYNPGLFMNFEEFRENKPSIREYEIVTSGKDKVMISVKGEKINPWGLCKDGELYKFYEDALLPIEKKGNGFIISNYLEKASRRNGAVFMASLFGGAIGGALASSSANLKLPTVDVPYLKKNPDACTINMSTGKLDF
jgi:hypothetical protein